ncbi:hypothetical protein E5Q_01926 [Mixia osmundae IAM 14324]|uniref:GCS light chain n=1 Tax=Mixia osmundae (strain CBS 9802 / IAM 14324 / JCM 22182 / KY 12970) TaxID=764103 RepID=G7DXG0_MIXOS|nr:hypothetical protein E5Q_01926 [Mixia osmundae IAM 14324]
MSTLLRTAVNGHHHSQHGTDLPRPTSPTERALNTLQHASDVQSLILYAQSILRLGKLPSVSLTSRKSNSELVYSLRTLLETSLPLPQCPSSCASESSKAESSSIEPMQTNGSQTNIEAGWCAWSPKERALSIPSPLSLDHDLTTEQRDSLDITAKFFYLNPHTSSSIPHLDPEWVEQAVQQFTLATGLNEIDLLILSLPGVVYDEDDPDGGCLENKKRREKGETSGLFQQLDERGQEDVFARLRPVWESMSTNPSLRSLGLSEFSSARMKRFLLDELPTYTVPPPRSAPASGEIMSIRRPRVNQINLRDCCSVSPEDMAIMKDNKIDLLTHSDCSDLLPPATFSALLDEFGSRLPKALIGEGSSWGTVNWVLKYTIVYKTRNVVADKGYIVHASKS